ncbi:hypothetical protein SAY87_011185 [Trapa incisa]|uniref:Uncharacterized protein n=1 Tax=Trapa incisa TaxID=236973 RepID=A0AAN7GQH8_9MYRT|nr:hypothetical protein SAY87_011185 [Trapa incisa]
MKSLQELDQGETRTRNVHQRPYSRPGVPVLVNDCDWERWKRPSKKSLCFIKGDGGTRGMQTQTKVVKSRMKR